jgi:hypothetical protein
MILSLTLALFGFASVAATVESYNETLTATSFNLNEANKHLWLSAAGRVNFPCSLMLIS